MELTISIFQRKEDKDPFCQRDMLGIPTLLFTECAWSVSASFPDASRRRQKQCPFHDIQVTGHFDTHLHRAVPKKVCSYGSAGAPQIPVFPSSIRPSLKYISHRCTINLSLLLLPRFDLGNPDHLTLLCGSFFATSHSQQNFIFVLQLCGLP